MLQAQIVDSDVLSKLNEIVTKEGIEITSHYYEKTQTTEYRAWYGLDQGPFNQPDAVGISLACVIREIHEKFVAGKKKK